MKGTALKIIPKFGNEADMASDVLKPMLSRIRHVTRELEAQVEAQEAQEAQVEAQVEVQVEPLDWRKYALIYRFRRRPATVKLISVGGDRHRTGNNTANASACYGITPTCGELLAPNLPASDQPSDQPASSSPDLVTDQPRTPSGNLVTPRLTKLTDQQQRILELCEVPRTQADLMAALGVSHRTFFRRMHLEPLILTGLIRMTHPDDLNHPKQACVVTETGLGLLPVKEPEDEDQHGEA